MIDAEHVRKAYGKHVALADVSFRIPEGCIFGLLGPNGSGKTTFIRLITQILMPDSGHITLNGEPLQPHHRHLIGYLPEERGLYRKMKVAEHLHYLLGLKGMGKQDAHSQTEYWLERMGLADRAKFKVQELSKGMQQKVQFIATIAHRPQLLILDEPFSGLDPINSQLLQEVIHEFHAQGHTIIFSTHRMEQVEQLCEHIALIHNGSLVLADSLANTRREHSSDRYHFYAHTPFDQSQLSDIPAQVETLSPTHLRLTPHEGTDSRSLIARMNERFAISSFAQHVPPLRDIFVKLVQAQTGTLPEGYTAQGLKEAPTPHTPTT